MEHWSNDQDIYQDMLDMSSFLHGGAPEPSPEPSELRKKLFGKPSMYEMDIQDDDLVPEHFIPLPVRGHPLLQNGMRTPGGRPTTTTNHQHTQTSANIREVAGFGYSNDLIEHAFKSSLSEDEKDPEKMKTLSFEISSPRKMSNKKSGTESDSSASTSFEYMTYSSRSNSSGCINGPDINSKIEFPDLK